MSGEAEPALRRRARRSLPSDVEQNGARSLGGLDEAVPTRKCSCVLDRYDELALMGINSSSLGTLLLVLDSSPRAPR